MNNRNRIIIGAIVSLFIIAAAVSLGSSGIGLRDTVLIIMHKIFRLRLAQDIDPKNVSIVWLLRLPRVLLAFLVGGGLALSGAGFNHINAVKNNRIYQIDTDSSVRPSSRIILALRQMSQAVYGDR